MIEKEIEKHCKQSVILCIMNKVLKNKKILSGLQEHCCFEDRRRTQEARRDSCRVWKMFCELLWYLSYLLVYSSKSMFFFIYISIMLKFMEKKNYNVNAVI